jgi:hypothetical protein
MDGVTFPSGAGCPKDAEDLAIRVLNFIVADLDRMVQFLNVTGLQPETIRESAKSALFLLGVLDYVSRDDELLKAIHQELAIRPAAIMAAIGHLAPEPDAPVIAQTPANAAPSLPRGRLYQ